MRYEFGGFVLEASDPEVRGSTVRRPDGSTRHLTPIQTQFLRYLMASPNLWVRIDLKPEFSQMLLELIRVHASNTRRQVLAGLVGAPIQIQGSKARGYRLVLPDRNTNQFPPVGDVLSDYCVDQATREDIVWAASLAARTYGGIDIISELKMLDWWNANPAGFSILFRDGQPIGNLDILPLRKSCLDAFVAGTIIEQKFTGADLQTPNEREQIRDLYVESVVIDGTMNAGGVPARHMLEAFPEMVLRVCKPRAVSRVYAISASDEGEQLLNGLGFVPEGVPERRLDNHQLWAASLLAVLRRTKARKRRDGFDGLLKHGL